MGIKINQYPTESTAFNGEDYYDIDAYVSPGVYESKKQKGAVFFDQFAVGLFSQTSIVTVGNTAAETSIVGTGEGSLTIPANSFKKGYAFHAKIGGVLKSQNNANLTINIYEDANLIATTGVLTLPQITDKAFELEIDFSIHEIGAAGVAKLVTHGDFVYNKDSNNIFEGKAFNDVNTTTFDTTTTSTLNIKAQFGAAHPDNKIQTTLFYLTKEK